MQPLTEQLEPPVWYYRIRTLDWLAIEAGGVACLVNLVVLIMGDGNVTGYVSFALLAAAIVIGLRRGILGLILAVSGAVLGISSTDIHFAGWLVVISLLFSLALRGQRVFIAAFASGLSLYAATVISDPSGFTDPAVYLAIGSTVAGTAVGYAIRTHENYLLSVRQRAQDAISSRDVEIIRRIAEERLRIAQDLHDVLGHEIAVISMNLGVIDVHLDPGDSVPRGALESAQRSSRRVLQETQRILGVLRRGDKAPASTMLIPAVARISDLVQTLGASGARVTISQPEGELTVESSVGVAAYRIAQEALTNAHRHGSGLIELRIRQTAELLVIEVENEYESERSDDVTHIGYGLIGMRERVEAAGGRLVIDRRQNVFRVEATLRKDGRVLK